MLIYLLGYALIIIVYLTFFVLGNIKPVNLASNLISFFVIIPIPYFSYLIMNVCIKEKLNDYIFIWKIFFSAFSFLLISELTYFFYNLFKEFYFLLILADFLRLITYILLILFVILITKLFSKLIFKSKLRYIYFSSGIITLVTFLYLTFILRIFIFYKNVFLNEFLFFLFDGILLVIIIPLILIFFGGIFSRIWFGILLAVLILTLADIIWIYTYNIGIYYEGSFVDFLYVTSYLIFVQSTNTYYNTFHRKK